MHLAKSSKEALFLLVCLHLCFAAGSHGVISPIWHSVKSSWKACGQGFVINPRLVSSSLFGMRTPRVACFRTCKRSCYRVCQVKGSCNRTPAFLIARVARRWCSVYARTVFLYDPWRLGCWEGSAFLSMARSFSRGLMLGWLGLSCSPWLWRDRLSTTWPVPLVCLLHEWMLVCVLFVCFRFSPRRLLV